MTRITTDKSRILVVAGAVGLYALSALWLLFGDGIPGLIALGAAIGLFAYLEKRHAAADRIRGCIGAAPGTAALAALAVAVLLPVTLASSGYAIHVLTMAFIFSIMAVGLNVHLGGIGLINIGYGGLFAIGGYAAALAANAGLSFWAAVPIAIGACVIAGALLGFCTTRTAGDYFALITLGFGLIVHQLLINMSWLTRGTNGIGNISAPTVLGHSTKAPIDLGFVVLKPEANFYYFCLAGLVLSLLVLHLVDRSWIGRTWAAMREDMTGTSCFGVNIPLMKVQTVAFGSAFAGLAGALYAYEIGFISPDDFTMSHSIELIAMVILGGIGNMWGVVAGAILLIVIPEKLRVLGDYRLMVYGALLVLLLVYRPTGLFAGKR